MMHILLVLLSLVTLLWAASLEAAETADPARELNAIQDQIEKTDTQKRALEQEAKAMEEKRLALQQRLVRLAKQVQEKEALLRKTSTELRRLDAQKQQLMEELSSHDTALSKIVAAMARLGGLPPEVLLAMPGDAERTTRSAQVLDVLLKSLNFEAEAIREKLTEFQNIHEDTKRLHATLTDEKSALDKNREEMNEAMAEHKRARASLDTQLAQQSKQLRTLSSKASSLKDLIHSLEEQQRTLASISPIAKPDIPSPAKPSPLQKPSYKLKKPQNFSGAKGQLLRPVKGDVILRYGEKLEAQDTSKGIRFRTINAAQVISPYDGEVVYTGPFLNYGNILIIRHSDRYHSLMAGVKHLTAIPGQFVLEGEPIGVMGEQPDGVVLYMEIRKDNKPIDPLPWLTG